MRTDLTSCQYLWILPSLRLMVCRRYMSIENHFIDGGHKTQGRHYITFWARRQKFLDEEGWPFRPKITEKQRLLRKLG